jgi:aminopeptidase-like protein
MSTKRLIICLFELHDETHESYILLGRKTDGIFRTICSKGTYVSVDNTLNTSNDRYIKYLGKHTIMYVYRTVSNPQTFEILALLSEFDELQSIRVNDIVDAIPDETGFNRSSVVLKNGNKVAKYVRHLLMHR